jgi:hypothetical protein
LHIIKYFFISLNHPSGECSLTSQEQENEPKAYQKIA